MKSIIIFKLLAITTFNPLVNAHENHDHQIYNWSNSKNNNIKSDNTINGENNGEKFEVIKNKTNISTKRSWINFFRR